ncbi:thiamine ABC transporter ATP-binding protein [Rhodophyticola porphyridii]|uniref:ATP-binding cassette domain-containing protein n=1 Tax=Rhodophyticola porphyridii TaxID=1852017 RepID=A0A3L9Y863_9RHOB|nr:ATP-binding cassette domain-containing protein [Rhodophyticola porphyridii]RMA43468.1 ATP-binding cassette domain-containing protein [Rhodophyticola porphyridii]
MLRLEHTVTKLDGFTLRADLTLEPGRRLAVLGASGSGKSTLLNLIAGFVLPDEGKVIIGGLDRSRASVADRPLSILFQDSNLFPHLSVFDNVALGLRSDLRLDGDQRARVSDSLAQVGMDGMESRLPGSLSGGQQSRVALARMLLRDQPLALMDEPFSALDPGLRREMLDLVAALCDRTKLTLAMVTHDLRDVSGLCTDLCLLESGRIVLQGPLDDILADPPALIRPWL